MAGDSLAAGIRDQPLHISNEEFHAAVVFFIPESRFRIIFDITSGYKEAVAEIVCVS